MGRRDPHVSKNGGSGSVTWKWLAVSAGSVLVLAGAGWLAYIQTQVSTTYVAIDKTKEKVAEQATDQAVTKSKVDGIDRKVDEVRRDVAEIKNSLQQILINQQQQILNTPKR